MKKSLLAIALLSTPAMSGWYSIPLNDQEYKSADFTVAIMNNATELCGGQLVANQFVITAAHCVSKDKSLIKTYLTNGADDVTKGEIQTSLANMSVFVGDKNRTLGERISAEWIQVRPSYIFGEDAQENIDFNKQIQEEYGRVGWLNGDIAVIKLTKPYLQNSSSNINTAPYIDQIELQGKNAIAFGWGVTETDEIPTVIRQSNLTYNTVDSRINSDGGFGTFFYFDVEEYLVGERGSFTASGDSGTPVMIDGKVMSYVTGSRTDNTEFSGAATFYHYPWLASYVDAVNTIGQVSEEFSQTTSMSKTWTIPVQSMKVADVTFSTVLNDDSGLFSLNSSTCDGTFATGDVCEVSISFNVNGSDVTDTIKSKLILSSDLEIPLSIENIYVAPPVEPPVEPPTANKGSGGGSFGLFGLFGLIFIRFFKSK